jgi:hypothetical protein
MADEECIKAKYQTLSYGNEQFDKNVLFIASGALGISFGFIEKVVPNLSSAVNKHFLINSWYCFAGVIFISLVAHFISILANRWAIVHDKMAEARYNKISGWWNKCIRTLNIFMILGLFFGVLLLVLFVKQNI